MTPSHSYRLTIVGARWRRVVYSIAGADFECDVKCHETCTCDLCTGPSEEHCQGQCYGNPSDHDELVMVSLAVVAISSLILAIFFVFFVTERCGCYFKFFSKSFQWGIEETQRHRRTSLVDTFSTDKAAAENDPFLLGTKATQGGRHSVATGLAKAAVGENGWVNGEAPENVGDPSKQASQVSLRPRVSLVPEN